MYVVIQVLLIHKQLVLQAYLNYFVCLFAMKLALSRNLLLPAILLTGFTLCSSKIFGAEAAGDSECSIYYLPSMNFVQGPPNGGSPDPYAAPSYDGASAGDTWTPSYLSLIHI